LWLVGPMYAVRIIGPLKRGRSLAIGLGAVVWLIGSDRIKA
jgi:hypothetical protein